MQRLAKIRDRKPFPATGKTHASHHAEKSRSLNPPKPKAGSPPSRPAQGQRWSLHQHLVGGAPDISSEEKPSSSPGLVHQLQSDVPDDDSPVKTALPGLVPLTL